MDMGWLAIEERALIGSMREEEDDEDGLGEEEVAEVEGDGVGSVGVLGLVASGLTTFEGWGWTRAIFFCCGGVMCGADDVDGAGSGVWGVDGGGIGVGIEVGLSRGRVWTGSGDMGKPGVAAGRYVAGCGGGCGL